MDANKAVSPHAVNVELTTGPVQDPVTTTVSDGQHASAPRVYSGSDALPRFMTGSAPVAHDEVSATVPQWEAAAGSGIFLQEESSTASSSSAGQTAISVAQAPQNRHAKHLSFLQRHKKEIIAAASLTAGEVSAYEFLADSVKAGDRIGVVRGFATLDSRKTLVRLLSYTNGCVMADVTRAGDTRLLQFLFDEAEDANFQDKHYDRMVNGYRDVDGNYLLDIAASRTDLEIGLMLAEKGAKPGPHCSRQFLDQLLEKAIASRSENAVRNLLGHGADWNLFFYSAGRDRFLRGLVMGPSTFFNPVYQFMRRRETNRQRWKSLACG